MVQQSRHRRRVAGEEQLPFAEVVNTKSNYCQSAESHTAVAESLRKIIALDLHHVDQPFAVACLLLVSVTCVLELGCVVVGRELPRMLLPCIEVYCRSAVFQDRPGPRHRNTKLHRS